MVRFSDQWSDFRTNQPNLTYPNRTDDGRRRLTTDDGQQTAADDRRRTANGGLTDIVYILLNIANVSDYVMLC
jgi:hypothetical protein